jgi:hypothetical protein
VVLENGQQYLVSVADVLRPPRRRYEVDPFSRTPHEDDLVWVARAYETRRPRARAFICFRRPHRQLVDSAVYVGVIPLVVASERFEDGAGFL